MEELTKEEEEKAKEEEEKDLVAFFKKKQKEEQKLLNKKHYGTIAWDKVIGTKDISQRCELAVRDREITERGEIPVLDNRGLNKWKTLVNIDPTAKARIIAYLVQCAMKAEQVWDIEEDNEPEYTNEPRVDLMGKIKEIEGL